MKKDIGRVFIVSVAIIIMAGLADAATNHSGFITVDETWTLAGSPHIIDGVFVENNATLTIEPGVEVRFNKDYTNARLSIGELGGDGTSGKLIAQGTAEQTILFTSNEANPQPGDWRGIFFKDTASDDSIIEHAIIEYAGKYSGNLDLNSANPTIRNCILRKSLTAGIYMHTSTVEISGCRFEDNDGYGMHLYASSPVLDANAFINNGSFPIYITGSGYPEPVIHSTNTFSGNHPEQICFGVGHITNNHTLRYIGIPYYLPGLTTVKNNATLTIEPGVEVRVNKDALNPRLIIGEGVTDPTPGRLIAQGTPERKILFTSNETSPQQGDWHGISFWDSASDDSILEHVIIEYAGDSYGNLELTSANPTIRNCILRKSLKAGIYMYKSMPKISGCLFEENGESGINMFVSSPVLDANTFSNNGSYPVYINNSSPGYPGPVITGTNLFSDNNPEQIYFNVYSIAKNHTLRYIGIPYLFPSGIWVYNDATLTIEPGVEVRFKNTILRIDPGTLIAQGTPERKILFTSNEASPQPGDWRGIYFADSASDDSILEHAVIEYGGNNGDLTMDSANPTIRHCLIRKSLGAGIYVSGSSSPEISCCDITENTIGIDSYVSSGLPCLLKNALFGNSSYGIKNNVSSITINAAGNWWGDASGPGGIGPGRGDAVSGNVDYEPWLVKQARCNQTMTWIPLLLLLNE